ncbi:hypothetical protein [Thiosocius teredinicola]|uniref:hypothetical protein n=1 Tax=Thiosocius teredinicola TaxID=1973002 RepID=UPI000990E78A
MNIWLLWFAATSYTAAGAGSAQADFDLAHCLLRFGVPVFLFAGVVVIGTFISKAPAIKWWRWFWGLNALTPLALAVLLFTVF